MTSLLELLTILLMLEVGGEPMASKLAVASVIWERAQHDPARIERVILSRRQFSCFNSGIAQARRNAKRMRQGYGGERAWQDCERIAARLAGGTFQPTVKATHYYNPSKASPAWAKRMLQVGVIGRHRFMR